MRFGPKKLGERSLDPWPLLIFAVALVLRWSYWDGLEAYPKYELIKNRLDDQVTFDQWARAIVGGRPFDYSTTAHEFAHWTRAQPGVFPQAPLYPYFVAATFRLFGAEPDRVRLVQMILGALGCVLAYSLARRFLRRGTAGLCGLAAAAYGPLIFYESTLLRAGLFNFVAILSLWSLVRTVETERASHRMLWALTSGLALGLGISLRANYLLFAILAMAWMAWRRRFSQDGPRLAAWAFLGCVVPLLPAMAINSWRTGQPAFLSSNGPYIFFLGNVHDATGTQTGTTDFYREVKARGTPEEIDLLAIAVDDITRHPRRWLALMGRKTVAFFSSEEIPNNLNFQMARRTNPRLRWAFLGFASLLPLALCGLALTLVSPKRYLLLHLFLLAYSGSIILFYVLGRLRHPVLPILLIFAGLALERLWQLRRRPVGRLGFFAVLVLGFLQPTDSSPFRPTDYAMAAAASFSRGEELERERQLDEARRHYIQALVLNPAHDQVDARLHRLPTAASTPLPEDLALRCEEARTRIQDDPRSARKILLEVVDQAPRSALPLHYLSNLEYLHGRPKRSMTYLEKALALEPGNALFRRNLLVLRETLQTSGAAS